MMKKHYVPSKRKKLGEILVRQGRITPDELIDLLRLQKEVSMPLGKILLEKEIISGEELTNILAEQLGIPHVWLRKGLVDPRIVDVLPKKKALFYQVIPMFRIRNILTLGTADPNNIFVFDEISSLTKLEVQPVICRVDDILEAIHQSYRENVSIDDVMSSVESSEIEVVETLKDGDIGEIAEMAEGSPVINMANMILLKAIREGASDIHLEPHSGKFQIRVRVDGILYTLMSPKIEMHPAVVSRLKVMANLDIAERRIPQDGRIQVNVDGRIVDLRFSSMPGIYGEKVVLRVLDREKIVLDINKLGMNKKILNRFKSLIKSSHGLILVCGPTGSGKTTTLYAALSMLNSQEKNIITIEDPVEYQIENINQNQVRDAIGLSFPKFLKHALRQDPDIILVGEIRDSETAEIAIQASLTGHLVMSTLHTNDSPSVITRLIEMRIEPYLIASSLLGCMAQRLVRTICPECKQGYYPSGTVLVELGKDENKKIRMFKGKGCTKCFDSGFRGRIGIYELIEVDDGFKELLFKKPTSDIIKNYLKANGFKTMRDFGFEKAVEGLTTVEEVKRVTLELS